MQGALKLGTFGGVEIRLRYTWLFAFILVAWSLAQGYFPDTSAGESIGTYWLLGIGSSLLLFASVLIHELGHSLVAIRRGLHVQSITLFIFGGVSNLEQEPVSPGVEFQVTVVGPLSSLVIAAICWAIALALV